MKKHWPIIHIIGLPGAGKTTLGKRLSKKLGLPVFYIGTYRARHTKTALGEADAWLALFKDISRHKWSNCILEKTGLNKRESFLKTVLPLGQRITVKLEASRKTLYERIKLKKKKEQGGEWLYSIAYPDKFTFVRKFYKKFCHILADYSIDTNHRTKTKVYQIALKEILSWILIQKIYCRI